MDRAPASRADLRIPSHGEQLAAYLYWPDTPGTGLPCVVMAHGFSGTRDDGLPGYAEAFQAAGFAVVLFDYRHFGASGGEPRQLIDIGRQLQDYRAVIDWARHTEGIDPDRIVLWGTSFSGGHVLTVGAEDPRIAAVIAQVPYTDSLPVLRHMPLRAMAPVLRAGIRDRIGALLGRPPVLIPAIGAPGEFAVLNQPEVLPGFTSLHGPQSLWRNEIAARLALVLPFYRPVRAARKLTMPVLISVCDADTTTLPGPSIKAAHNAPRGELRRYPYGHFDIYHDPQAKADQLAFLKRVLGYPGGPTA